MKRILFVLLLTIPFLGFGQNRYYIDEVTKISDTPIYLKNDKSLVNGIFFGDFGMCKNDNMKIVMKNGKWR